MATEKAIITHKEITAAARMAERGKTHDGKIFVYTDSKMSNLRLMVQGKKASWIVRWKDSSVTIAYVFPEEFRCLTAPKTVREFAGDVLNLMKDDPAKARAYVDQYWSGKKKADALEEVHKRADTWTLQQCVDATIEGKTSEDSTNSISDLTVKDYRTTFNRPEFKKAMQKPAAMLTRGDIEAVRDHVRKHSGISPAIKVITYTRAVLNYCARNHSGQSGLGMDPWWNYLSAPYKLKPKDRRPEVEEIVKTMLLAEEYLTKPLPGRAHGVNGVKPGTLAGLWWLVLTCQRANAGMSLLAHDIVPDPDDPAFMIAAWAEDVMKAGQAHVLPVPKRAWDVINGFREKGRFAGHQEWAFPSESKKDVHATSSGVYRILYRLAGKDALVQAPKEPKKGKSVPARSDRRDLLAETNVDWWSMHDLRRSITHVLGEHGIPGGATVVLAHDIHESTALAVNANDREREDFQKLRTARITKMAYGGSQYLKLKKEAMQIWVDAVLDEYERQKSEIGATEAA